MDGVNGSSSGSSSSEYRLLLQAPLCLRLLHHNHRQICCLAGLNTSITSVVYHTGIMSTHRGQSGNHRWWAQLPMLLLLLLLLLLYLRVGAGLLRHQQRWQRVTAPCRL